MNIREIEALTRREIEDMALAKTRISGHSVFFCDLGEGFGYSALVCFANHHIYHADLFELHYRNKTREELHKKYVTKLSRTLFKEKRLTEPCPSYREEKRRKYFIANIYSQRREYESMWRTQDEPTPEELGFEHRSWAAMAYYKDGGFARHIDRLAESCHEACVKSRDAGYMRDAFAYEMANFEYGISMDKDYEVIDCFQRTRYIPYGTTEEYLAETEWPEEWKQAYREAKRCQLRNIEE